MEEATLAATHAATPVDDCGSSDGSEGDDSSALNRLDGGEDYDSGDYQSDGLGDGASSSASKRRKIADTGAPTVAPWNR